MNASQAVLDEFQKRTGVHGKPAFHRLSYWDWAKAHLVDFMHTQAGVWQRNSDMLYGNDFNEGIRNGMGVLGVFPTLTSSSEIQVRESVSPIAYNYERTIPTP